MTTSETAPSKASLYELLEGVSLSDERTFRRRLSKARAPKALGAIKADIDKARLLIDEKSQLIPSIT